MFEQTVLLVSLLTLYHHQTKKKKRRPSRFWVHPLWVKRREQGDYCNLYKEIRALQDHEKFFNYTRMSFAQFDRLLSLLKPFLTARSIRKPLNAEERLLITLRYLSTGTNMQTLSYNFRCGRKTIWKVIHDTCPVIWDVLNPIVLKQPTTNDWLRISLDFWNTWQFPLCLGAIDGKHVAITCPKKTGSQFFNYKGFFSLVLLAACDAKYNFTLVDIGQYGSQNDAGIFACSGMGQKIADRTLGFPLNGSLPNTEENPILLPYAFVADEMFPLLDNLKRPYPGRKGSKKLNVRQTVFNYRLSRARRVIENTFGILMTRWRIFQGPIVGDISLAEKVTKACVCLHNYVMQSKEPQQVPYLDLKLLDVEGRDGHILEGGWQKNKEGGLMRICRVGSNNCKKVVMAQRNALAEFFVSAQGRVSWQFNYALRGVRNIAEVLRAEKISL